MSSEVVPAMAEAIDERMAFLGVSPADLARATGGAGVDREVARRLVPFEELREFAAERGSLGESVTVADIAEHFEVPRTVARRAARMASHPAAAHCDLKADEST